MRCNNCGWDNPAGNQKCEKCKSPLTSSSSHDYMSTVRDSVSQESQVMDKTIRENVSEGLQSTSCKYCGYLLAAGAKVCPACGERQNSDSEPLKSSPQPPNPTNNKSDYTSTIRSGGPIVPGGGLGGNIFFTLRPIAWDGEDIEYQPKSYSGKQILLNRANTDANNMSITSKEQALLTRENDGWYIENRSEMQTTYVKVNKKTKLEDGDIILLGNRFFEFKGK